jgi:hypothetical protein
MHKKSVKQIVIGLIISLTMVLAMAKKAGAACTQEGKACTSNAQCCQGTSCYLNVCRPLYPFPSYAKVKVDRNPNGQSFLYLEFEWQKDTCAPNFGSGRAVEFEIHIKPKCFLRPVGGKDNNHNCDEVMGKNKYNMPKNVIPGIGPNCYVDIWNYWIPPANQIGGLLQQRCPGFNSNACAATAVATGAFDEDQGNFSVGLHDASVLQTGVRYSIRYPVEINDSPECLESENLIQSNGPSCYFTDLDHYDHGDWGRAWITMQTFSNTCRLTWPCDNTHVAFTCPELIGADSWVGGCQNVRKYTDFWLNRLCVPTGDWPFTPGLKAVGNPKNGCIDEAHSGDLSSHGACCWDMDGDKYFAPAVSTSIFGTKYIDVPMFGTRAGDCNDNNSTVNPGAIEIIGDGMDNDCRGGDSPLLGTTSPPIIACSNCSFEPTCWDGIQNQDETGIDCGGSSCPPCSSQTGPEVLASGLNPPRDITVDSTYVYWVEKTLPGALRRVPKSGGQVMTLTSSLLEPTSLTIAGNYAYILERNNGSNGRISRVPLSGGTPEPVTSGLNNAQDHLVQDGTKLFWGDYGMIGNTYGGMIKSAPLGVNVSSSILVQGNGLDYLSTPVDVDTSYVYFAASYGKLMRVAKGGGTPSILDNSLPCAIRWYGATLYFTDCSNNPMTIKSMPKTGGSATLLATGGGSADLAVDGSHVYWIEYNNNPEGGVYRVSVNGGSVKTYSDQSNTIGIEVDSTHVYWAQYSSTNDGKIMRAPK